MSEKRHVFGIEVSVEDLKALRGSAPTENPGQYMEWLEAELLNTREMVRDCYFHSTLAGEDGAIADQVRTAMENWGMRNGGSDE